MNSLKGLLFLFVLFTSSVVFGQTITGTVTGDNLPLPGVNIVIEGTQKGTVTDFDGLYSIDGVQNGDVIVYSSIGFVTKNITYIGNSVINVNLEEDIKSLDEVVVVGYNKTTRAQITVAASTVKAEELSEIPAADISSALEGRASGVRVASSGSPGEEKAVFVRGLSTFGDARPLYVVDGVFVESITQISPEAIASVNVLKDAAAAAIYGSRGSNGVIIVTTKKGKAGKSKFGFSTYTGIQFLNKSLLPDLASGPDLANVLREEDGDPSTPGNQTPARLLDPNFVPSNVNYVDEIFREAEITNYNIDFSGGSDSANYSVNAGYFDQEGIQQETRFRRYTTNINSEFKISDRFKVGQSLNLGYSKSNLPFLFQGRSLQVWGLTQLSYLPIQDAQGRFVTPGEEDNAQLVSFNPLLLLDAISTEELKLSANGNVYGEFKLLDGLTNRTSFGFNYFNQEIDNQINSIIPNDAVGATAVGRTGRPTKELEAQRNNIVTTIFTNNLSYNKTFGRHNVNGSFVFERVDTEERRFRLRNNSTVDNGVNQFNPSGTNLPFSEIRPTVLTSYLGSFGYSFDNRYFINGSARRDASSVFAEPVGWFRALSGAWTVSNESFFDPISAVVSNLKLRASIGETGNNNLFPFRDTVVFETITSPNIGGVTGQDAFNFSGLDQPTLTWQRDTKSNFGIDLGLFGGKVNFAGEYYQSETTDLLGFFVGAGSAGNGGFQNAGSSEANGFEFSLGYNDDVGDFKWSAWGQVTTVNTEVTSLNLGGTDVLGEPLQLNDSFEDPGVSRLRVGEPVWGIYGSTTNGLYRSEDQIIDDSNSNGLFLLDSDPSQVLTRTFNNGVAVFTDANGNDVSRGNVVLDQQNGTGLGDIVFVENDALIGDPNPDFTYSFNLKAEYKGFDASALFTGVQGVDLLNATAIISNSNTGTATFTSDIVNRFTLTNTNTDVPRFTVTDPNVNTRVSDRLIEDGSYLRLRSLVLGYSLANKHLENLFKGSISKLRFYVQGQNLFTITDYSGLDPEVRPRFVLSENGEFTGAIGGLGVDVGTPPAPVSVLMGVQLNF